MNAKTVSRKGSLAVRRKSDSHRAEVARRPRPVRWVISVSDGHCEWAYDFALPDDNSIARVLGNIEAALRVRATSGRLRVGALNKEQLP